MTLLNGKRLLITGVLTRDSIAWATADRAQELGAEILLTSFGRTRRLTERAARSLPQPPDVLELDVNSSTDHEELTAELERRWGAVDGVLHSVAAGPLEAFTGGFLDVTREGVVSAFETSAYSYMTLARSTARLMAAAGSASYVGVDFEHRAGWAGYDWMGVAKSALRTINGYLAAELGPHGIRCNIVSSGPVRTVAGSAIPGMAHAGDEWPAQAPLGWDIDDAGPVADAICLLMSDLARGITGELVHVDGGLAAAGGWTPPQMQRPAADLDQIAPLRSPA